ncbi:hypothetical protein RJT34_02793 [Clitoria ternatea]|uniref:Uncharacterized protein n=1 Tax=Clitoria ternatea TaxID=43366 RepID=A0AAN9PZ77_CLITE
MGISLMGTPLWMDSLFMILRPYIVVWIAVFDLFSIVGLEPRALESEIKKRTDDEPLQKLFMLVRSKLNLDLKNIKREQAKCWMQHPALIKTRLNLHFPDVLRLKQLRADYGLNILCPTYESLIKRMEQIVEWQQHYV